MSSSKFMVFTSKELLEITQLRNLDLFPHQLPRLSGTLGLHKRESPKHKPKANMLILPSHSWTNTVSHTPSRNDDHLYINNHTQ